MQNAKPVVLFDIDFTLFNRDLFLESLFTSIGSLLGIEKTKAIEVGQLAYRENILELDHFDPEYLSSKIAKKLDRLQDLPRIESLIMENYNNPGKLYAETYNTIEEVSRIATIGIFSKGHEQFQKNKIKKINHLLHADHIYMDVNKYEMLPKIIAKYKLTKLYLIDDLLDVLYLAKKLKDDVVTVWVKRGRYAMAQEDIPGFKPDAEVENLSEVVKIVKSNL